MYKTPSANCSFPAKKGLDNQQPLPRASLMWSVMPHCPPFGFPELIWSQVEYTANSNTCISLLRGWWGKENLVKSVYSAREKPTLRQERGGGTRKGPGNDHNQIVNLKNIHNLKSESSILCSGNFGDFKPGRQHLK